RSIPFAPTWQAATNMYLSSLLHLSSPSFPCSLAAATPSAASLESVAPGGRFKAGVCQYPTHPTPYSLPHPASLAAEGIHCLAAVSTQPVGCSLARPNTTVQTSRVSGRLGAGVGNARDSNGQ